MSVHTGVRFAEVGFLLMLIAGVWIAASEFTALKHRTERMGIAGVLLAVGAALVIAAIHWGYFGVG